MALLLPYTAHIALGSNLGDRREHITRALALLAAHPQIEVARVSALIETAPMYVLDQPPFLNGCATLRTQLQPLALLDVMHHIEQQLGRQREIDKGPRTLDLDLLLFDDHVCDTLRLTLPHPGMSERDFVLIPLAEIVPDARHPTTGKTISELLDVLLARSA